MQTGDLPRCTPLLAQCELVEAPALYDPAKDRLVYIMDGGMEICEVTNYNWQIIINWSKKYSISLWNVVKYKYKVIWLSCFIIE